MINQIVFSRLNFRRHNDVLLCKDQIFIVIHIPGVLMIPFTNC